MQFDTIQFLNYSSEAFCLLDGSWRYIFVNRSAAALLGKAVEDLIGKTVWDVFPEAKASTIFAELQRVKGESAPMEFCALSSALGRWLSIRAFPAEDGVAFFVVDVTDTKTRAEDTYSRESYFRTLLDSTGDGIYALDLNGNCTFMNSTGSAMLGFSQEEVLGTGMHLLTHHTRADGSPYPRDECYIYRAFRHGEQVHISDEKFWRKDGTGFSVEYTSYPVREGSTIVGAVVAFNDITVRLVGDQAREKLLLSEQKVRKDAEESNYRALSLAGELANERDKLSHANAKLQATISELESATRSLREKQEHQALITRLLRGANKVTAQFTGAVTLEEKFQTLVQTLRNDFRMVVAGVWICPPSGHTLIRAAEVGLTEYPTRALEATIDVNIHSYKLGWVARLKRPFVSHDLSNDIQMDQSWNTEHKIVSAAFFPLVDKDKLLGVIACFSRYELPIEGADIIGTMASVLAASIQSEREESDSK